MVSQELLGLLLCKFPPLEFDMNPPVNNLHSWEIPKEKVFYFIFYFLPVITNQKKKILSMIPAKEIELISKGNCESCWHFARWFLTQSKCRGGHTPSHLRVQETLRRNKSSGLWPILPSTSCGSVEYECLWGGRGVALPWAQVDRLHSEVSEAIGGNFRSLEAILEYVMVLGQDLYSRA